METFKDGSAPFNNETLSDTEVVVTASNTIDHALRIGIITLFRDSLSATALAEIFEGDGPLSSFDSKIRICRGFKLISPDVKQDLDIIRTIRNRFAHTSVPRRFTDSDIEIRCKRLRCPAIGAERWIRYARGEDVPGIEYWKEAFKDHITPDEDDSPLSPEEINQLIEQLQIKPTTPRHIFVKSCQIVLFSLVIDIVFSSKALILVFKHWEELVREAHIQVLSHYATTVLGKPPSQ